MLFDLVGILGLTLQPITILTVWKRVGICYD